MEPVFRSTQVRLYNSDCVQAMSAMLSDSVDSIVTDPPYELGFMGKSWDSTGVANSVEMWREALRVLKPGGHLLAFSGSRTYHRMTCAIEDAGFEIRDQIMWVYGSGFPKSHNISKSLDKMAGAVRENGKLKFKGGTQLGVINDDSWEPKDVFESTPVTDSAKQWNGWGTALKPAHEPIVLARKPLVGTVAQNVLTFGTGGLNIDGSRVGSEKREYSGGNKLMEERPWNINQDEKPKYEVQGRWPANFIHDGSEEVVELLGEPARFFYCAKTSKTDRNEGLDGFANRAVHRYGAGIGEGLTPEAPASDKNHHPTVKPTQLMRYLCRLITPPNGIVLDPFMGSGSTGKAAILEGFRFIGIDQSAEYCEIARARIEFASQEPEQDLLL